MNASSINFDIDGRKYEWVGGFGAILQSQEKDRQKGDVRYMAGRLFTVFAVRRLSLRPGKEYLVSWTFAAEGFSMEDVRAFKEQLLK